MMNDVLYNDIYNLLSDGNFHSVSDLCADRKYNYIEVKEVLLELLKEQRIQNMGTRWKLLEKNYVAEQKEYADSEKEYFVVCPECGKKLQIELEFLNMKATCPACNTYFVISTEKSGLFEYNTILYQQK